MPRGVPNKPKTVEDVELPPDDGHGSLIGHLTHQFRDEADCGRCLNAYLAWEDGDKNLDAYHAAVHEARRNVADPV